MLITPFQANRDLKSARPEMVEQNVDSDKFVRSLPQPKLLDNDSHSITKPPTFKIKGPSGDTMEVSFRPLGLDEAERLLRCDETDEVAENMRQYWEDNPEATYRWDTGSGGEIGLINDIARQMFYLRTMGQQVPLSAYPRVATARLEGEERVLGIATHAGQVKFHSDSRLRAQGYKGIGTALVGDYLKTCLAENRQASFDSVNNSYGFYEALGFEYSNPEHTPTRVKDPSNERFSMHLPQERTREVVRDLASRYR